MSGPTLQTYSSEYMNNGQLAKLCTIFGLTCAFLELYRQLPACYTACNVCLKMLGMSLTEECAASSLAPDTLMWVAEFGDSVELLDQLVLMWRSVVVHEDVIIMSSSVDPCDESQ